MIQDADSTQVEIGQEPPLIDGATLEQTDGLEATWSWCPTPEQIETPLPREQIPRDSMCYLFQNALYGV